MTPSPNSLSPEEVAKGWQLMFNGTDLSGWHNFNRDDIGNKWTVEDGTLYFDPERDGRGGDIVFDQEFENYELRLEWKISPCGNSGIMFNVQEEEQFNTPWQTGPEMQILDNTCHPDAKIETHRAGDLYDLIECKKETVKPAGSWNKVRIRLKNGKLNFWLNGTKVVSTEMWTREWDQMVAKSKFRDMPGFGKYKKGKIALQDHGNPVWFRNIKIKEL